MANEIGQVEPPAIPIARDEYDRRWQDQYNNVLRLYFNRLNTLVNTLLSPDAGAQYLYTAHAEFYDTTTQTALATGTEYVLTFNTTTTTNNISLVSSSQITVEHSGVYLFNVYGHVDTTGAAGDLTLWAKKNGTNIAGSARRVNVSVDGPIQFSEVLTLTAGDYIQFYWETDNTNVEFSTVAAGTNYPQIPSVAASVSFVSNG